MRQEENPGQRDEYLEVLDRRFHEAWQAGLSIRDAAAFSENDTDIGLLRKLVDQHVEPAVIAKIVV